MRRQVKMKQQRELVEKKARAKEAEMRRQRELEEKNTSAKEAELKLQREIEALKAMRLQSSNKNPKLSMIQIQ